MADISQVLPAIDHTNLKQNATAADIRKLCAEAAEYGFATVAINSCWVKLAAEELAGTGVGISSCIGFPLGAACTEAKVAEAKQSVADGTTEIDMVVNGGLLEAGDLDAVTADIRAVVEAVPSTPVKVIIECCLLTDEQKEAACRCSMEAGAAFVKTSTGFSTGGATVHDVELMRRVVGDTCQVKAAGGIHSLEEALAMLDAGADRLGMSAGLAVAKEIAALG